MQLRLSLSFFVVMLLGACSSVVSHSIFSVPEADFSIEYPQGWVVEGGRPASELFAIHRPFSFGEELTPLSCSNGTEHFYLEASNHYLAVGFEQKVLMLKFSHA